MRDVKEVQTTCANSVLGPSCVKKGGGVDVRERSEFFQHQTHQLNVRMVVLGVRGFCPPRPVWTLGVQP